MVDRERIANNLAVNVRKFRDANELSMRELAKASGTTHAHISRMESGQAINTSVVSLMNIAEALGVSVAELLEDSEDKKTEGRRRKPATV